jgi:hypothetical protein
MVLIGPKTSVQNSKMNSIPAPNGKREKIKPTTLDFSPTNCNSPAARKTMKTIMMMKITKTSKPTRAARSSAFVNNSGKFIANPIPEPIQSGAGVKRAKTYVPKMLRIAPIITNIFLLRNSVESYSLFLSHWVFT